MVSSSPWDPMSRAANPPFDLKKGRIKRCSPEDETGPPPPNGASSDKITVPSDCKSFHGAPERKNVSSFTNPGTRTQPDFSIGAIIFQSVAGPLTLRLGSQ